MSNQTLRMLVSGGQQLLVAMGIRRKRRTAPLAAAIGVGGLVGLGLVVAAVPRWREVVVRETRIKASALAKLLPSSNGANEGEGSRSAARRYEKSTREFVSSGKVEPAANAARRAVDGPEGDQLRRAEDDGLRPLSS
jgi:hypothetical protein